MYVLKSVTLHSLFDSCPMPTGVLLPSFDDASFTHVVERFKHS